MILIAKEMLFTMVSLNAKSRVGIIVCRLFGKDYTVKANVQSAEYPEPAEF